MKFYEIFIISYISFLYIYFGILYRSKFLSSLIFKDPDREGIYLSLFMTSFFNALLCYTFFNFYNQCYIKKDIPNPKNLISKYILFAIRFFIFDCFEREDFCSICNYYYLKRVFDSNTLFKLSYLGRIIFTILSLESLFFFYNIIIQYLLIFTYLLIDMENIIMSIFFGFFYIVFVILLFNILIIPTYEFITFPYLRYYNPNLHLESFKYIEKLDKTNRELNDENNDEININLINWGICFIILFLLSSFNSNFLIFKDIYNFAIIIYNLYHYMTIIWCYFLYSFIFIIKILQYNIKRKSYLLIDSYSYYGNNRFSVPKVNLIRIIIDSYLDKENKKQDPLNNSFKHDQNDIANNTNSNKKFKLDNYQKCVIILKTILILIYILALIYLFINYKNKISFSLKVIFIIIYFIMMFLLLWINFPIKYIFFSKYKNFQNHTQIIISKIISLFFAFMTIFLYAYISFKNVENPDNNIFKNIILKSEKIIKKIKNAHNLCVTKIYDIPLYLYLPFINDVYYYNSKDNFSSFYYDNYTRIFFDESYKINNIEMLTKDNNKKRVKMVQYNIQHNNNNVTILSIRGTFYKRDFLLDTQLYFPSLLINILNTFSNFDKHKYLATYTLIAYGMSIPYRIFFQFFMVEEYLNELLEAIQNKTFSENIVVVGHSLGGGLAKIFARIIAKKAISLSGPGINTFHYLFKYQENTENFELTSVDIVPDYDLIPRLGISGGTIYRILCLRSPAQCHSKELSLCESLIICRNPNAKNYCEQLVEFNSDKEIKEYYEATKFNDI